MLTIDEERYPVVFAHSDATMMQSAFLDHWLIKQCKQGSQGSLRLFCFPYAGGSAQLFSDWSKDLPETVEVCSIELPGRGTRVSEPPFTQLLPLVEAIATAIHPLLIHQPFAFFGHSLGALISFELSRVLVSEYGLCPSHLYVSGRAAPHLPKPNPIHNLPEPLFLDQLRHLNGTPEEVLQNAELMQLFVPTLRADFALNDTYTYTEAHPLNCPITAFGGLQDPEYNYEQLEAWHIHTTDSFSLKMFPGGHFFIKTARHLVLQALAQALS